MLEHVSDPFTAYREIGRVLKPGGCAVVTTPFMYRIHEAPYDFFRYTPFSHRAMAEKAGLQVSEIRPRGGYLTVLLDYWTKGLGMIFGGVGRAVHQVTGRGRNLAQSGLVRFTMEVWQRLLFAALKNESIKSQTYTLGYVVVLGKQETATTHS